MDVTFTIGLTLFLGCLVGLAGLGLYWTASRRVARWRSRVEGANEIGGARSWSASFRHVVRRLVMACGRRTLEATREGEPLPLPNRFAAAGLHGVELPLLFQGAKVVGAATCFLTSLVFYGFRADEPALAIALCGAAPVGGWYGPDLWLRLRIRNRQQRILAAFPDALDLMVVCVEAGLSLDAALSRVGQELKLAHRELSEELQALFLELRTGRSRQQALRNAGLRMQLEEVQSFVALLIQTERFGTRIGLALRAHADSLRRRHDLQATEFAAKLPVKLLFPLIFFIFPSLLVVLLGSAVIQVFRQLAPNF